MTNQEFLNEKYAEAIKLAREMGNQYDVDLYGRFPWNRAEHRGRPTTLSKASIGEFCYAVLRAGGEISSVWPFSPQYTRSAVFYTVRLSISQKIKIEAETAFRFDPPPVAHVN